MANIYNTMVVALRDHWKAHDNAYPQRFELTEGSFKALIESRKTVINTMHFTFHSGWENDFLGVHVAVTEGVDCLIDKDGNRLPLSL